MIKRIKGKSKEVLLVIFWKLIENQMVYINDPLGDVIVYVPYFFSICYD